MILHIDMDAFYASVEEREQPELRGKPLVVSGSPSARGVVSAANYASREFGIHSAMPVAKALKLCPHLQVIRVRGKLYAEVSAQIHEIFNRYTPLIESLSLDEAFLDPSGSERLHGDAEQIGKSIKRDILTELQLVASVGIAPNKFLAKLASDHDKPDGFTVIQSHQVQSFLDALPVERIWGVGKSAKARLHRLGIYDVSQLCQSSEEILRAEFGKHGEQLWRLAHGIDDRQVIPHSEAKSISQETTFATDVSEFDILQATALDLTEGVCYRLRQASLHGNTVHLKIRFKDFSTITRARTLTTATNVTDEIWNPVKTLLQHELGKRKFWVRLIGVGVTNFTENDTSQIDLFEVQSESKKKKLDELSDEIRDRYGKEKIRRGKSLLS